jgi:hypothetical protein
MEIQNIVKTIDSREKPKQGHEMESIPSKDRAMIEGDNHRLTQSFTIIM